MRGSGLSVREFWQLLIDLARQRIRSGVVSERGLARQAGLSQPHLHNVLKGIRELSPRSADQLMEALDVTVPQVIWSGGGVDVGEVRPVPLLRDPVGPGGRGEFNDFAGYIPFPARIVSRLVEPVAAWLSADLGLPADFRPGDLILMDRDPGRRIAVSGSRGWVVAESAGFRVRYVRRTRGGIELGSDPKWPEGGARHAISLGGRNVLDIVRAGIVWIGREMETPLAGQVGQPRARD